MKYKINLFPAKEENLIDKIIYFSFHYLRYILVITQIIVIAVFFYRFKIDQEIVDLKDALMQKQEIITVSLPLIKEISAIEKKTTQINEIMMKQNKLELSLKYLLSVFPEKLFLQKLTIDYDGNYNLVGWTTDPNILRIFYNRLQKDKRFERITLKNIIKEVDGYSYSFTLKNPVITK
ncbi:MAG: hypothetical protein HYW86_02305 [Candidatus Roizmanbacteria bacterium]|nr:MAG: hypothetical protein HYW86_02305 [Candidatus Roizmanbacteria bacterium]